MVKYKIIHSNSQDPWFNLSLEDYLVQLVSSDYEQDEKTIILYLWQNDNTVVIGRNQNAWTECTTSLLEKEGGKLARRTTGGGAVFHDMGNLNFSIITPKELYDITRSLGIIVKAAKLAGVEAYLSGRNDILAQSQKFSGNAFLVRKNAGLHHGTILIDSDYKRVGRYLNVSKEKLQSKGIKSVRSRIINLSSINKDITVELMEKYIEEAVLAEYGPGSVEQVSVESILEKAEFKKMHEKFKSWEWCYGESIAFSVKWDKFFPWGSVCICFNVKNGIINEAYIYTDALDGEFFNKLAENLKETKFVQDSILKKVLLTEETPSLQKISNYDIKTDICEFIKSQNL